MVGCISPSLADLFLPSYEEIWLDDYPKEIEPTLYRRYVDDCFLIFSPESMVTPFLQYLNSPHHSIKFTCEKESNNMLVFLDIHVTKTLTSFDTGVFGKKLSPGLSSNLILLSYIVINSIRFNI